MPRVYLLFISTLFCIIKPNLSYCQQNEFGLIFLNELEYKKIPLASTAMMGTLPASKDLSEWFPTPGNQGNQASCVGWAVAYGLKSYHEAVERGVKPMTNSQIYSPAYIFNQIKISHCKNGSYISKALDLLRSEGVCTITDFPYSDADCSRQPSSTEKSSARSYAIADWRTVSLDNDADIKSHIASGFPVVIGMMVDDGFVNLSGNNVYRTSYGKQRGGHAMVVTGYDDNIRAFKVLNSWGTQWGNLGFGWISYDIFKQKVREAYAVQDIVVKDPTNPLPTPSPIPNTPPPAPSQNITALLGMPIITHNIPVNMPSGQFPGMLINVPGNILNGKGANAQLVIRFYFPNGAPLMANVAEPLFRDIYGLAAVGSPILPVYNDPANTGTASFAIPYYALNLIPTGGFQVHQIAAVATLYVNQFEKARSQMITFQVRF